MFDWDVKVALSFFSYKGFQNNTICVTVSLSMD